MIREKELLNILREKYVLSNPNALAYSINDYRLKVIYYFNFLDLDNFVSCLTADYKLLGEEVFNKFLALLEPKMSQKLEETIKLTNSAYRKTL